MSETLPISLSDSQLDAVMHAAQPLAPIDRSAFLAAVADALRDVPIIGDGTVHRVCAELLQRRHFAPPIEATRYPGKYATGRRVSR